MPTSLLGFGFFVALLVPGLVYLSQRRARFPLGTPSALVEAATLATVSLVTNALALAVFGLVRFVAADHTPDPRRVVEDGWAYSASRLSFIGAWVLGLLLVSCALAFVWGRTTRFAPSIVDLPAWFQIFESTPADHIVHLGCDMRDGSYIAGYLDWYSSEVDETADRDLALAAPIIFKRDEVEQELDIERVVLSARDLVRIYVAYVPEDEAFSDLD